MVVLKVYNFGILSYELECETPITVDAHRPVTGEITLQGM